MLTLQKVISQYLCLGNFQTKDPFQIINSMFETFHFSHVLQTTKYFKYFSHCAVQFHSSKHILIPIDPGTEFSN